METWVILANVAWLITVATIVYLANNAWLTPLSHHEKPTLASAIAIIMYMLGSTLTIVATLELTGRIGLAIILQITYTSVFLLALTYSDRIYQLIHRSSG